MSDELDHEGISEEEAEELLEEILEESEVVDVYRVSTFEEAGLLTLNRGLVVLLDDGSPHGAEFQLTIKRSR